MKEISEEQIIGIDDWLIFIWYKLINVRISSELSGLTKEGLGVEDSRRSVTHSPSPNGHSLTVSLSNMVE